MESKPGPLAGGDVIEKYPSVFGNGVGLLDNMYHNALVMR